jgi:hypothetical protein
MPCADKLLVQISEVHIEQYSLPQRYYLAI